MDHPASVPSAPERSNRSRLPGRLAVAAVFVAGISLFYAMGWQRYADLQFVQEHLEELREWVSSHWLLAISIYAALYVAVTALSLPVATIISLVGGAIFGRWLGTLLVSLSSTAGATLAFLSSRYLLRDLVQARFSDRLEKLNQGVERDGAYYLFTLRLLPVVPFFLINLGMGLTRLPARVFSAVSWVGMLPGTFVYVNAGTALASITSLRDLASPEVVGSLTLLGIAPLAFRWLLGRKNHRRQASPALPPPPLPGRDPS